MFTINNYDYNLKKKKKKIENYNVLDLVWDNYCDARSHIKDIPCQKLHQAEKVRHICRFEDLYTICSRLRYILH